MSTKEDPSQSVTEWMLKDTDPNKWKPVVDAIANSAKKSDRQIYALGLTPLVIPAGQTTRFFVSPAIACRILGFVIEEPTEGLRIRSIEAGRIELLNIGGDGAPASMFSGMTCSACRDRACQALVGKSWPAVPAGVQVSINIHNHLAEPRAVHAAFVVEDQPIGKPGSYL